MRLSEMDDLVSKQIKQAQDEGKFDNLPGKGRPFQHLDTHPLGSVLKAQGFTARWAELDQEIQERTESAESALRRTHEWAAQSLASAGVDRGFVQDEWRKARHAYRET